MSHLSEIVDMFQQCDQGAVANSQKWLIAKVDDELEDSRPMLESLGFTIVSDQYPLFDGQFYEVQQPEGWTKRSVTNDGFWTAICDPSGTQRLQQFYKGGERSAFVRAAV